MTYQPSVPNASQSPAIFPAQGVDNFTRLKALFSANHKFNASAGADDGYHMNIKMLPISAPSNDTSVGQAFVNSANSQGQLSFQDRLNRLFQVTPTIPIYAAVNFSINDATITNNFSFNVNSPVTYQSAGDYSVVFTTALPSNFYVVSGTVQTATGNGYLQVKAGVYNTNVTPNLVNIQVTNFAGSLFDPQAVFVVIMGG